MRPKNHRDDVVFEIELIRQTEINVDYILMLVEKYRESAVMAKQEAVHKSPGLLMPAPRNKRDLVEAFVDSVSTDGEIEEEWRSSSSEEGSGTETSLRKKNLRPEEATNFVERAFRDGTVATNGIEVTEL